MDIPVLGRGMLGRRKIYTNFKAITRENIIDVLKKAYSQHRQNAYDMQFLIDYERGIQPLKRPKTVRKDINIQITSSLPNYIKEFNIGYNWGSPVMLVQRGNKELHGTDSNIDDLGISALNEQLKNIENIGYKDQCMAEFVEIVGIGHKMVDIKTDFPESLREPYTGSLVEDYDLDSRYAFCVYYNGPSKKKLLGATYIEDDGKLYFTCTTDKWRFEIEDWKIVEQQINPLGMVNIVEFERLPDRTGCFERKIPEIDALNILESDFANDVSQRTQEMWWGDNIDFKEDENGNPIKPKSGDWILTFSSEGKVAKIQPLSSNFDGGSTLSAIGDTRTKILQDCYVPIQYSSSGGGSTGTATDMSSGWSATELMAQRKQQVTERGKREELELILRAIRQVPTRILPAGSPIRSVHSADLEMKFLRSRNYDMSIKANTFATYFNCGVHPRHILQLLDSFQDVEQTYLDSKSMFDALQEKMVSSGNVDSESEPEAGAGDPIYQIENSPILDGLSKTG